MLEKGFAATSIEELIAAVGITKSGLFYHFKDKGELAKALLVRYVERENLLFDELFARCRSTQRGSPAWLPRRPQDAVGTIGRSSRRWPSGCLVASFCYQERLFDKEVRDLNAAAVLGWRKRFRARLDLIAARYPPRIKVDLDDVADMLSVMADGGIILSRIVKE